jgi:hypothetical protein
MLRRAFASSMVVLLLSLSALAAACDVNCSFPWAHSGCHLRQSALLNSSSGKMNMSGMDMSGMTMPVESPDGDSQSISAITNGKSDHPSIGEMGPCERQSCGEDSAVSAKTCRFVDSRFHCAPVFLGTFLTTAISQHSRNARDDLASLFLPDIRSLTHILRI